MSEQNSHAEIIAEMRIFKCRNLETGELELCNAIANYLADRLEAAHKREVDALKQRINELNAEVAAKDAVIMRLNDAIAEEQRLKMATAEKSSAVGNAAKLREAVVEIVRKLNSLDENCAVDPVEIRDLARAALAAPPRNCDIGTAEENGERFKNFCRNHQFISVDSEDNFPPVYVCSNESCPLHDYYIAHGEDNCELAWAQLPYESEAEK